MNYFCLTVHPTMMFAVLLLSCLVAVAQAIFPGGTQACYTTPSNGKAGGVCLHVDCCANALYTSNLCASYPNDFKCCYSSNKCGSSCGTCSDSVAKNNACNLLANYEKGRVWLHDIHYDPSGNDPYDGASALDNIRDTCEGRQAKRSSYGNAPGGCVCLTGEMVKNLYDYTTGFWSDHGLACQVNDLCGSSHSANSWHYQGNTFDVGCTTPLNHCVALENFCSSRGAIEMCYPGSSCGSHETWVHCAF